MVVVVVAAAAAAAAQTLHKSDWGCRGWYSCHVLDRQLGAGIKKNISSKTWQQALAGCSRGSNNRKQKQQQQKVGQLAAEKKREKIQSTSCSRNSSPNSSTGK